MTSTRLVSSGFSEKHGLGWGSQSRGLIKPGVSVIVILAVPPYQIQYASAFASCKGNRNLMTYFMGNEFLVDRYRLKQF